MARPPFFVTVLQGATTMKRQTYPAKLLVATFWLWCITQANTVNATPLSLSDVPLIVANAVEANVMFTLDDSGSMQWEFMPDEDQHYSTFMFPRKNNPYGGSTYSNQVPTFADSNQHNFFGRSPQNNKVFYNPDVDYKPWLNADGTSMANANPTAALYNPAIPGLGSLNLTAQQTETATWFDDGGTNVLTSAFCAPCGGDHTYWPITYYLYNGASTDPQGPRLVLANYTKVQITTATSTGTTFTSPNNTTRTRDQEIQNFANWFSYYRSRILAARAGVGRAFAQQGTNLRVGFGAINYGATTIDGIGSAGTVYSGLRRFTGADRTAFFDNLYGYTLNAAGTPLRNALDDVGRYYLRTDNRGPWGEVPGTNDTTPQLECRKSFHILTTDGYWNGNAASTAAARANVDGSNGPVIPNPAGPSYQYIAGPPYADTTANTLADVGMYYWNRDLRTDLPNEVPTDAADPAFWQHLVNFTVGLGVTGTLDPATDLPGLTAGTTNWPAAFSGGTSVNIDDLWHTALNSRGEFYSAADPDTFAAALSSALKSISDRVGSAAAVATNSGSLQSNSMLYQGRFNSGDWSGQLLYYAIDSDPVSPTFGSPLTTGSGPAGSQLDAGTMIPDADDRNIITLNGSAGVPFRWGNISTTQQTALGSADVLNYLRGDSTKEQANTGGIYRNRTIKLGDVVNSAPIYVGPPSKLFPDVFGTGAPENGAPYSAFKTTYSSRASVVYVGANDGMLHGFDAETGTELMAYIPGAVYSNLALLSSPSYDHKFYVDGTPTERDAFYNSGWHTVLVGGLNNGGKGVYALDITDTSGLTESNAANLVLWEFTSADDADLGYTYSQPDVVRMNNGKWAAIFGNGYNSSSATGDAVLFIVDIETGALIKKITTKEGTADDPTGNGRPNGLASVTAVDLDNNYTTDVIYAGDLFGNMWKFDVSSSNTNSWGSAYGSGPNPKPLFTACDNTSCSNAQPITTRPRIGSHPTGQGVMVYFGTGQYLETSDNIVSAPIYKQSYYGIWDNDAIVTSRSSLLQQTIDAEVNATFTNGTDTVTLPVRLTSANEIDWQTHEGWYMDLVVASSSLEGERQVTTSVLREGRIIFTTIIPGTNPCDGGGSSWLMELDASSGARLSSSPFDLNNDGDFSSGDYVTVTIAGVTVTVPVSGTKSPNGLFSSPNVTSGLAGEPPGGSCVEKKTLNTSSGTPVTITESCGPAAGRLSWRQLR